MRIARPSLSHCLPKLDPMPLHGAVSQAHPKLHLFLYQLAFFTPGKLPASACNLKLYCYPLATHPRGTNQPKRRTLDILKSLKIPRPLPPRIHRLRIWVGRV